MLPKHWLHDYHITMLLVWYQLLSKYSSLIFVLFDLGTNSETNCCVKKYMACDVLKNLKA